MPIAVLTVVHNSFVRDTKWTIRYLFGKYQWTNSSAFHWPNSQTGMIKSFGTRHHINTIIWNSVEEFLCEILQDWWCWFFDVWLYNICRVTVACSPVSVCNYLCQKMMLQYNSPETVCCCEGQLIFWQPDRQLSNSFKKKTYMYEKLVLIKQRDFDTPLHRLWFFTP